MLNAKKKPTLQTLQVHSSTTKNGPLFSYLIPNSRNSLQQNYTTIY